MADYARISWAGVVLLGCDADATERRHALRHMAHCSKTSTEGTCGPRIASAVIARPVAPPLPPSQGLGDAGKTLDCFGLRPRNDVGSSRTMGCRERRVVAPPNALPPVIAKPAGRHPADMDIDAQRTTPSSRGPQGRGDPGNAEIASTLHPRNDGRFRGVTPDMWGPPPRRTAGWAAMLYRNNSYFTSRQNTLLSQRAIRKKTTR